MGIQLSPADRVRLEKLVAAPMTPQKHVWRAQIVLLSADGAGTVQIMRRTGRSKPTVWRWQARFAAEGVDGLLRDKTRPPGKKPLAASVIRQVVTKTTTEKPPAATHWTARAMAKAVGIAVSSVQNFATSYSSPVTAAVEYWNPATEQFTNTCEAGQPQQITITIVDNTDHEQFTNSFVVDSPLDNVTTGSGGGGVYGAAAQLVFTTEPVGGSTGEQLATQPVVTVEDSSGNTVADDLSPVLLTLSGPGVQTNPNAALTGCAGTETEGVVTFTGCTVNTAGTYTITATDGNLSGSWASTLFTVSVRQRTTWSSVRSPPPVPRGRSWPRSRSSRRTTVVGSTRTGRGRSPSVRLAAASRTAQPSP